MNDLDKTAETLYKESLKERAILIINQMINLCQPFTYEDFNKKIPAIDSNLLSEYEKKNPEVGLAYMDDSKKDVDNFGISTLSIIATLTDILVEDRLAFQVSDGSEGEPPKGQICGVSWLSESIKKYEEKQKKEDLDAI